MYRLCIRVSAALRYEVYDADSHTPCRYHLLKRGASATIESASESASVNSTLDDSSAVGSSSFIGSSDGSSSDGSSSKNITSPLLPGAEGRWALPPNPSDLQGLADMYRRAREMYDTYVVYYLLQVGAHILLCCLI